MAVKKKIDESYNSWAAQYDSDVNKTRDLESKVARETLGGFTFHHVIELGCGTGKNTVWIAERSNSLVGLDFSAEMLLIAKRKIQSPKVEFRLTDLNNDWGLRDGAADLVSCSLTLEHIQDLTGVFRQAKAKLKPGGLFYLCELHPFRQYVGSQAKFTKGGKTTELAVFVHSVSDYVNAAIIHRLEILELKEWFDEDQTALPRLISFVMKKSTAA